MTKKDYELIAKNIKEVFEWINKGTFSSMPVDKDGWHQHQVVRVLGLAFEEDNPKFNYDKFYKACGVPKER